MTTPYFKTLRDGTAGKHEMGQYVREGYASLYKLHPNAHAESDKSLFDYFKANTNVAEGVVRKMVSTFRVLCEFASFDATDHVQPEASPSDGAPRQVEEVKQRSLTVNVRIELNIPAIDNAEIYDKLFASMAKHIKSIQEA